MPVPTPTSRMRSRRRDGHALERLQPPGVQRRAEDVVVDRRELLVDAGDEIGLDGRDRQCPGGDVAGEKLVFRPAVVPVEQGHSCNLLGGRRSDQWPERQTFGLYLRHQRWRQATYRRRMKVQACVGQRVENRQHAVRLVRRLQTLHELRTASASSRAIATPSCAARPAASAAPHPCDQRLGHAEVRAPRWPDIRRAAGSRTGGSPR